MEKDQALHSMAAHLHRYASELQSLDDTVSDIKARHSLFTDPAYHNSAHAAIEVLGCGVQFSLEEISHQLSVVKSLRSELESKIQNILALVFLLGSLQLCGADTLLAIQSHTDIDRQDDGQEYIRNA